MRKASRTLLEIAAAQGPGSQGRKLDLLGGLLDAATPPEARYLLRLITGNLRLGIGTPAVNGTGPCWSGRTASAAISAWSPARWPGTGWMRCPGCGCGPGEAVAYDPVAGELRPFQEVMFRRRKHGIADAVRDVPVGLFCFDLLYADGCEGLLCKSVAPASGYQAGARQMRHRLLRRRDRGSPPTTPPAGGNSSNRPGSPCGSPVHRPLARRQVPTRRHDHRRAPRPLPRRAPLTRHPSRGPMTAARHAPPVGGAARRPVGRCRVAVRVAVRGAGSGIAGPFDVIVWSIWWPAVDASGT